MKCFWGPIFIVICVAATSAAIGNDTNEEIIHLFEYLEKSNCQFNRNGIWYSSVEAAEHINLKYRYLKKRDLINSAEQFIDRAASRSSMSKKPYLVRCGDSETILSSTWFGDELKRYRKANE